MPPGIVTVTGTTPLPAGLTAWIVVGDSTVNSVALLAPKCTAVTPLKPVPVIVTWVPPAGAPSIGLTPVTVGSCGPATITWAPPALIWLTWWMSVTCTGTRLRTGSLLPIPELAFAVDAPRPHVPARSAARR